MVGKADRAPSLLHLLYDEAPLADFDALLAAVERDGPPEAAEVIRDVDAILAAIVRRARQLLHCDMTYLSLNDEADGASFMKVTDGAPTREFQTLRLSRSGEAEMSGEGRT